nr:MAG TPA: hypothetical protein [Bacteriophage sp.]
MLAVDFLTNKGIMHLAVHNGFEGGFAAVRQRTNKVTKTQGELADSLNSVKVVYRTIINFCPLRCFVGQSVAGTSFIFLCPNTFFCQVSFNKFTLTSNFHFTITSRKKLYKAIVDAEPVPFLQGNFLEVYNSSQTVHGAGHLVLVKNRVTHFHDFSDIVC